MYNCYCKYNYDDACTFVIVRWGSREIEKRCVTALCILSVCEWRFVDRHNGPTVYNKRCGALLCTEMLCCCIINFLYNKRTLVSVQVFAFFIWGRFVVLRLSCTFVNKWQTRDVQCNRNLVFIPLKHCNMLVWIETIFSIPYFSFRLAYHLTYICLCMNNLCREVRRLYIYAYILEICVIQWKLWFYFLCSFTFSLWMGKIRS